MTSPDFPWPDSVSWHRYAPILRDYLSPRCRRYPCLGAPLEDIVEELTHEAYIKLRRSRTARLRLESLRTDEHPDSAEAEKAYLYDVGRSVLLDRVRSALRRPVDADDDLPADDRLCAVAASATHVDDRIDIDRALADDPDRDLMILVCVHGFTVEEATAILVARDGKPRTPNNMRVRVARAKKRQRLVMGRS